MTKARCLTITALLLLAPVLHASSVAQMTFNELVSTAELIFEGRVIDKHAELDSRGMIHTYVTFAIEDVFKGRHSGSTIVLPYLGGTVGKLTLQVSDLQPPDIGEKGIYFVESVSRPPAHPLCGWDQGHFLVLTDDTGRVDRVFSHNRQPLIGFTGEAPRKGQQSTGVALGLLLADTNRSGQAIPVRDFSEKIRGLLPR